MHSEEAPDTGSNKTEDGALVVSEESAEIIGGDSGIAGGAGLAEVTSERRLDFIDDGLALTLAQYGKKYGDANQRTVLIACIVSGFLAGFFPVLLGINVWPFFLTAVALCTAYATVVGLQVMNAYSRHDYRTTSRLLSHALWWNAFCAPFTYYTFFSCSQIQSRLLLSQGRYAEMEALLLISRAAHERRVVGGAMPKHAVIANDLACTYIAQYRFSEAAELLKYVLAGRCSELIKHYARLNLALCSVKMNQVDEASKILDVAEKGFSKPPAALRLRAKIVKCMIDVKSQRYEEAEQKLEDAIAGARKSKESNELLAICYITFAELRWKQDRIEEADLYYRTGVDLYKVNSEPSYWSLAAGLREYAEMLRATGDEAESAKRIREAELYESAYLEREMMRLTVLKYRVTHEKPVRVLADLVNVDGFPPLSIELNPPDKDGFQQQPDLDEVEIEARKLEAMELEERKIGRGE